MHRLVVKRRHGKQSLGQQRSRNRFRPGESSRIRNASGMEFRRDNLPGTVFTAVAMLASALDSSHREGDTYVTPTFFVRLVILKVMCGTSWGG